MQVEIFVPDEILRRAEGRAYDLGVSTSEFFTLAATRYLDVADATVTTQQINDALDELRGNDASAADAVVHGHWMYR